MRPHDSVFPAAPIVRALLLVLAVVATGVVPDHAAAQDLHSSRRLSPVGIAKTHVGDTYLKVTYGRPYLRARAIFGPPSQNDQFLVPFGQVWRTGANEATEISMTGPMHVAGERLEAGTYAIFTVPGPDLWTVHFSPQLGLDGTGLLRTDGTFTPDVYDPARDVLVMQVTPRSLGEPVDPLTFVFEPTATGADLVLRWETTEVRIPMVQP